MTAETSDGGSPQARPFFRRLAGVLAVLCFLVAGLFGWFLEDDKWVSVGICLFRRIRDDDHRHDRAMAPSERAT